MIKNTSVTLEAKTLTVVMPCFNESDGIEATLREWTEILDREVLDYELLVINDGSTDGTGRILDRLRRELRSLRVIHQLNTGYGNAVRRGCELARGKYILQVDPNGRYESSDFLAMWKQRTDYHLILGVRDPAMGGLLEQAFTPVMTRLAYYLFGSAPKDPNVPFRLFRKDIASPYFNRLPQEFECVNLCVALEMKRDHGSAVGECPIQLRRLSGGKERCSLLSQLDQGMSLLTELVRLRFTLAKTKTSRLHSATSLS